MNNCEMKVQECVDVYDKEEAKFGLHPPVDGCMVECEKCPEQVKRRATMQRLQLDLNYVCDLGCYKCDRHLDVAPGSGDENVLLEQVARMLNESVEENYMWKAMLILGGEPTLHPQFREIVELICEYRTRFNPQMRIRMASNGYSSKAKLELKWVSERHPEILVVDTKKKSRVQEDFVNVRMAPKDLYPDRTEFRRCEIPCYSGLGFNYSGFYGCATGGATARIFGLDIGIKSIKNLTYENMEKFYQKVCPLCGHGEAAYLLQTQAEGESPTWKQAIRKYHEKESKLFARY